MEKQEISIYIDDSGQLHPNYHSDYFIYGGYWCFTENATEIADTYGLMMGRIYRTKKEIKSSDMKDKHKRKVLRRIFRDHNDEVNPIYIASYIPDITIDFSNKESVQLHKNYILRRLVEDVINHLNREKISVDSINVYIDNQSQTTLTARDSLEKYIENYFDNHNGYLTESYTYSNASFNVEFLESSHYRNMQLADLFANCKFCRYDKLCLDSKVIFEEFDCVPLCRKHPIYFTRNS